MLLFTTEQLPADLKIVKTFGIVAASKNKAMGALKDKLLSLKDTLGGTSGILDKAVNQAIAEAIKAMTETAQKNYPAANAIIGVRLDTTLVSMKEGKMIVQVTAYGTVAKLLTDETNRTRQRPKVVTNRKGTFF